MGGFKRTVTVSYGFVQVIADLTASKATDKDESLVQVCTEGHDPVKPTWDPFCPACDKTVKRASLAKARELTKDVFVPFTAEEIADLKAEEDQYKGKLALTAHEATDVEGKVMPSGTTYYLAPNKNDQFFTLLREMMLDNPDLAFMGLYTVTSRAALYRVLPYGDLLVAQQMLRPDEMVAAPAVTPQVIPEQMLAMAKEVARGFVTPFDPAAYADTYKAKLAEAVAAREATPGAALPTSVGSASSGPDPMAAMMAQMQAMLGNQTPEATKKAPAKRTRKAS